MVSIITPSFNSAPYIDETYRSVLGQTDPDWEWIIVDDGSTDDTEKIALQFAASDSRIRFFKRTEMPKGATTCRNQGVRLCQGDYLIFLDTDDVLASFCIEQRANQFQLHPENDFLVFQMMLFNEQIDDLKLLWNLEDGRDDLERAIRLNPVMAGSSTIWKKESFMKVGMWDEKILINQDIELHIRALTSGMKYVLLLQLPPDLFVRNNQQSISRAKKKSIEKQRSRVYYFNRIVNHLKTNQLTERYQQALGWLFLKLFFDLSFDRNHEVAAELFQENKSIVQNLSPVYRFICLAIHRAGNMGFVLVSILRFANRMNIFLTSKNQPTFGRKKHEGPLKK